MLGMGMEFFLSERKGCMAWEGSLSYLRAFPRTLWRARVHEAIWLLTVRVDVAHQIDSPYDERELSSNRSKPSQFKMSSTWRTPRGKLRVRGV